MKAETEGLIELMFDNKRQYQIPVYQRNYSWTKDNCLELFEDVLNAYENEKSHFLGTIVQVQKDEENGIRKYIIIDGQQRMTSIYLLLKALYDNCNQELLKEDLASLLFNFSTQKRYDKDERNKLKLKPIKSDDVQFTLLMTDRVPEMDKTSDIYNNYNYFCQLIKKAVTEGKELKGIKRGLEYLKIVMISLKEPDDEPQVIFERINSTGQDLKLSDLVRNYLLMTDSNMDVLFEEYWLPLESLIGTDKIDDYFNNYLVFKLPEVSTKNAYQQFKKYADKLDHLTVLKELKKYSKYYNVLTKEDKQYSANINYLLSCYRLLKQSTIYPFLFSVFDDFENERITEDTLIQVLSFFLNYTVRRSITGVGTNSLRGLYKTLYKRIFDGKDVTNESYLNDIYVFMADSLYSTKDAVPSDSVFKEKLGNENLYKNLNLCRFILGVLENGIFKKENVIINDKITVEHIMPQNSGNAWWQNEIGEQYGYVYDKYLHTLGNLTLTGYNSELSDKSFPDKVALISSNSKFVYLNEDVVSAEHWNEKSIVSRANRLSEKLVKDFSLPSEFSVVKTELIVNQRHTVYDGFDLTKCKPTKFVFQEKQRTVTSFGDMIRQFCEILYELAPDTFEEMARKDFSLNGATTPLFSYNVNNLRTGKEISDKGIFVETNKSSNEIIKAIKQLLDEYSINWDDFVFFVDKN